MDEMLKSLRISSRIQQEAVRLLASSRYRFMVAAHFRHTLVASLAPVRIKKVNEAIDALVEQKLIMRQVDGNRHEIGLNKEIWRLSSETIISIREATASIAESMLIDSAFCHIVNDVKVRLRKMRINRRAVSDIALDILVTRFLDCEFRLNADKKIVRTSSFATGIKVETNSVAPPEAKVRQLSNITPIKETTNTHEPNIKNLEDWAYEQVGEELNSNNPDKGLWTKAFAQADGDDKQTKVLYIRARVEKLIAVEQARLSNLKQT